MSMVSMRTVILRDIINHHKGPLHLWTYKTQRIGLCKPHTHKIPKLYETLPDQPIPPYKSPRPLQYKQSCLPSTRTKTSTRSLRTLSVTSTPTPRRRAIVEVTQVRFHTPTLSHLCTNSHISLSSQLSFVLKLIATTALDTGVDESVTAKFPGSTVEYGTGASNNRTIPESEGGSINPATGKMYKAGEFAKGGVGAPEAHAAGYAKNHGGDDDVRGNTVDGATQRQSGAK
jgi:hypothetical protein